MKQGNICERHPELNGLRYNGGNCPECSKAAHRTYRENNREKILQEQKQRRLANPEKYRALGAKWREKNKTQVRENNLRRTGFTLSLLEQALQMRHMQDRPPVATAKAGSRGSLPYNWRTPRRAVPLLQHRPRGIQR